MPVPLHDVIDPRLVDFPTWADRLVEVVFKTSAPPLPPPREDDWRSWAERLFEDSSFVQWNVPHPAGFSDWREWGAWVKGIFP